MNIVDATSRYERWLRRHAAVVPADLKLKHRRMAEGPFEFLRATYYRWVQIWDATAGDLAKSPAVLAVGDLHVENFGTWRDAEGRLVWGVNDFDEADKLPFTLDLTRLCVSAVIAARQHALPLGSRGVSELILDGYADGIAAGGRPFVLEESHPALRAIAQSRLKDAEAFWVRLRTLRPVADRPPRPARRLLSRLLPKEASEVRIAHRVAGLGSLGRRRFTAVGELSGGFIAREVKELVPPASTWARGTESRRVFYSDLLESTVRCPDPFLIHRGRWVGRRLSPSNSRIEIPSLNGPADLERVLHSMGFETANVHLGGGNRKRLRVALRKLKPSALAAAIRDLERAVARDWKRWRGR